MRFVIARGEPVEVLGHLHVSLVGRDHEARVGERCDLLRHRVDDGGCAVADGGDGDARAEVDELVAVGVREHAATGRDDVDRQRHADTRRHGTLLARLQLLRDRAGNGGDEPAFLGECPTGDLGDGHGCPPYAGM